MNLIGQRDLKLKIDDLCENNKFPKVFTVLGKSGFGKTSIVNYIAKSLQILDIIEIKSIDDIRNVVLLAPSLSHNILVHVTSFEQLNFRAKESLLKLCEDVPNFVYIALEVTNLSLCEDRFINRSHVFELDAYSKQELHDIILSFKSDISSDDVDKIMSMVGSPKEFKLCLDYGVDSLFNFMNKVIKNISSAQVYNIMKIADNISTKSDDGKIPILMFLNIIKNMSFKAFLKTKDLDMLNLFKSAYEFYEECLKFPKANKKALFDNFILNLKEEP